MIVVALCLCLHFAGFAELFGRWRRPTKRLSYGAYWAPPVERKMDNRRTCVCLSLLMCHFPMISYKAWWCEIKFLHVRYMKCAGHEVCRESWLRYMGIGKQRLQRTKKRQRGLDERTLNRRSLAHALQSLGLGQWPLRQICLYVYIIDLCLRFWFSSPSNANG